MGFFQDLFGDTAANAATQAGQLQAQGYNQAFTAQQPYYGQAVNAVDTGYGQARDALTGGFNQATGTLKDIMPTLTAGSNLYADLTGANGPEGQARARMAFQTDPGYQFQVQQATQQADRLASKYGQTNSGGNIYADTTLVNNLANQSYGQWAARLAPYVGYGIDVSKSLADLYGRGGAALAGVDVGRGQDLSSLYGGEGNLLYGTISGGANAQAAGELGAAKARTAAAGNVAGLATKLLGYALAPATGGLSAGIGTALSSAFNPASTGANGYYVNQQGGFPAFLTV